MKQATKRLLKLREDAQHILRVEQTAHAHAKPNHCFQNAVAENRRSGNRIVAGWIVGDYHKHIDQSPIMFHFWNCDDDGNHYDTTPLANDLQQCFEYVRDDAVYFESQKWCKDNGIEDILLPPAIKMTSAGIKIATREQGQGFGWSPQPEQPFSIYDLFELRARFQKAFAIEQA